MNSSAVRTSSALLLAALLLAPTAVAQDARVVVADQATGELVDIDFFTPASTVLNTDPGANPMLQSVTFMDDGLAGLHLVAADGTGRVVYYDQAMGNGQLVLDSSTDPTHPVAPSGLSFDPDLNLYGVSTGSGDPTPGVGVWVVRRDTACTTCLPGSFVDPVGYLDTDVAAAVPSGGEPTIVRDGLLEDTILVKITSGNLVMGDLLVLVSTPGMVLRYKAADIQTFLATLAGGGTPMELRPEVFINPEGAAVPIANTIPDTLSPNGMDLSQEGELLISTGEGTVLHYRTDGTRFPDGQGGFVDFATGLGSGRFQVAIGYQDGEPRAFVTDRNGGRVLRFIVELDGTGTLEATNTDPTAPVGAATTTTKATPTPPGPGVVVMSSNLLTSTIENVTTGGATNITEFIFTDPRESEMNIPPDQPLHRSLFLGEINSLLPPNVEIPPHVRAFRRGDPATGEPTFILLVVESTALNLGIVSHASFEETVLGYEPDCLDPISSQRPRFFWTHNPDANEVPIPEGEVFVNATSGCGDEVRSRGLTRHMSLFLPGARDTRTDNEILRAQITGIGLVLRGQSCIEQTVRASLFTTYRRMLSELNAGQLPRVVESLRELIATVEGNPTAFATCVENESGALRARANVALFTLGF
jgi:hypothetical protein